MKKFFNLVLAFVFGLSVFSCASTQGTESETYDLTMTFVDLNKKGVEGYKVSIEGYGSQITGEDGIVCFKGLPKNEYVAVTGSKPGHIPVNFERTYDPDSTEMLISAFSWNEAIAEAEADIILASLRVGGTEEALKNLNKAYFILKAVEATGGICERLWCDLGDAASLGGDKDEAQKYYSKIDESRRQWKNTDFPRFEKDGSIEF